MHRARGVFTVFVLCFLFLSLAAGTPARGVAQADFALPTRPVDWTRYTTVFPCLNGAVRRLADSVSWRNGIDTTEYDPAKAANPGAVAAARACLRALPPLTRMHNEDLSALRVLALVAGNDSMARAAIEQQFTLPKNADIQTRAELLVHIVSDLVEVPPAKLALAHEYLARLDSMGSAVVQQRLSARRALISYHQKVLDVAAFARELDGIDILARKAVTDGGPNASVGTINLVLAGVWKSQLSVLQRGPIATMNAMAAADGLGRSSNIGKRIQPIPAFQWYRRQGPNTPTAGKVSLLVTMPEVKMCPRMCPELAELLRFSREFPSVEITLITETQGYVRGVVVPPAMEAELARARFLDTLGLPGALAVIAVPTKKRPAPDSRVDHQRPKWLSDMAGKVLVLPDGRIVDQVVGSERMLRAVTKAVLADPGVQAMMRRGTVPAAVATAQPIPSTTTPTTPPATTSAADTLPAIEYGPIPAGRVAAADVVQIPIRIAPIGPIILQGTVNGQRGILLLDTGCPFLVMNTRHVPVPATNTGVSLGGGFTRDAHGDVVQHQTGLVDHLQWGGVTTHGVGGVWVDLQNIEDALAPYKQPSDTLPLLGMLGLAQLQPFLTRLDYAGQQLTLYRLDAAGHPRVPFTEPPRDSVPVQVTGPSHVARVFITAFIHDQPVDLLMDTGAGINSLNAETAAPFREYMTDAPPPADTPSKTADVSTFGISGRKVAMTLVRLDRLVVGKTPYDIPRFNINGTENALAAEFFLRRPFALNLQTRTLYLWDAPARNAAVSKVIR